MVVAARLRARAKVSVLMKEIVRREFTAQLFAAMTASTLFARMPGARAQVSGEATMIDFSSFLDALHADRPAADRADKLGLYGWLIGRWQADAVYHLDAGATRATPGEIHAGWVLEGRALQDVWIFPARDADRPSPPRPGDFYGTTLRVYDPKLAAWHIVWTDPLNQVYRRQVGRARGNDIVQEGQDESGAAVRWTFTEITPDGFRWLGERSPDGGATFRLLLEIRARRVGA
jgi:hypothetical protein